MELPALHLGLLLGVFAYQKVNENWVLNARDINAVYQCIMEWLEVYPFDNAPFEIIQFAMRFSELNVPSVLNQFLTDEAATAKLC